LFYDKILLSFLNKRKEEGEEEEEDKGKLVYISLKHSSQNVFLDNLPYLQSISLHFRNF
jgi:hypothetical protein